jgi:hypothetical protein
MRIQPFDLAASASVKLPITPDASMTGIAFLTPNNTGATVFIDWGEGEVPFSHGQSFNFKHVQAIDNPQAKRSIVRVKSLAAYTGEAYVVFLQNGEKLDTGIPAAAAARAPTILYDVTQDGMSHPGPTAIYKGLKNLDIYIRNESSTLRETLVQMYDMAGNVINVTPSDYVGIAAGNIMSHIRIGPYRPSGIYGNFPSGDTNMPLLIPEGGISFVLRPTNLSAGNIRIILVGEYA